jgi:AcrR family transcriptional regulator
VSAAPLRKPIDRAAAVRSALRTLVARHGFHGASMSAVAAEAGVATGTAYVHYASKDDLVYATYLEVKQHLGAAAISRVDARASAERRFEQLWRGVHRHLSSDPDRARFLLQVETSPYARTAHRMVLESGEDAIMREATRPDLMAQLAPLPLEILYDLGIGPAVRLAATAPAQTLDEDALGRLAAACWRAITRE